MNILKMCGLKETKQRAAIVDILEHAEEPISADEIYLRLADSEANFSTVYRTLSLLVEKSAAEKIDGEGEKSFYTLKSHDHKHYLMCTNCHKMVDIDSCPIDEYSKKLSDSTGFVITGHSLKLTGICAGCARAKKGK